MSEEYGKTLKEYEGAPAQTAEQQYMFTPSSGYGGDKYSVGNTNEPVQDSGSSGMSNGPDEIPNTLWPTLTGSAATGYKLAMTLGHVDARKHVDDAALPIAITDIPGQPNPITNALTVASGDKIFCEIVEDVRGVATAAAIKKAAAWPTSTAAVLVGGNDQTGTEGARNVRLCEIVTESGLVQVKVYHSGNIAHFAPELLENTTTSPSAGSARVMKQWNVATGTWDLRYLTAGDGIIITENTDDIKIEINPTYDFPNAMPSGVTDGDMLYWDATAEEWILLPAPAPPDTGKRWVIHHDGTAPEWVGYDEVIVNICEDGTPTEYTILGIPTS